MDNSNLKVLVTCPPMLGMIEEFRPLFAEKGITLTTPEFDQTMTVAELLSLVPDHDGWIIGDDPVTSEVIENGKKGRLRVAIKWGIGVDNIDKVAIKENDIQFSNTPGMFGNEVADLAISYVLALARDTFLIDRKIRAGQWYKSCGISLQNKNIGVVGFGDIGQNVAHRARAFGMNVTVYDPYVNVDKAGNDLLSSSWPDCIDELDFLVFTCALTEDNYHMLEQSALDSVKPGIRIVNVARGPLIDEKALLKALKEEKVAAVALDVFEDEPLPIDSELRTFDRNIFGSHNGSNTVDAVIRASNEAIRLLFEYMEV